MSNLIPIFEGDEFSYMLDLETGRPVAGESEPWDEAEYVRSLHADADRAECVARCYFIGGADGPVKIGMTVNVGDRLKAIQACSPIILSILAVAPGGLERESAYHRQFMDHRLHGEWFERCPEIEAEIARLTQ